MGENCGMGVSDDRILHPANCTAHTSDSKRTERFRSVSPGLAEQVDLSGRVVVQDRLLGAGFCAHLLWARFRSCIESCPQRSAEIIILLPMSLSASIFIKCFRISGSPF